MEQQQQVTLTSGKNSMNLQEFLTQANIKVENSEIFADEQIGEEIPVARYAKGPTIDNNQNKASGEHASPDFRMNLTQSIQNDPDLHSLISRVECHLQRQRQIMQQLQQSQQGQKPFVNRMPYQPGTYYNPENIQERNSRVAAGNAGGMQHLDFRMNNKYLEQQASNQQRVAANNAGSMQHRDFRMNNSQPQYFLFDGIGSSYCRRLFDTVITETGLLEHFRQALRSPVNTPELHDEILHLLRTHPPQQQKAGLYINPLHKQQQLYTPQSQPQGTDEVQDLQDVIASAQDQWFQEADRLAEYRHRWQQVPQLSLQNYQRLLEQCPQQEQVAAATAGVQNMQIQPNQQQSQ